MVENVVAYADAEYQHTNFPGRQSVERSPLSCILLGQPLSSKYPAATDPLNITVPVSVATAHEHNRSFALDNA